MENFNDELDMDVEFESDIVDEYERPGSRLGFFGNSSEEFPSPQSIPQSPTLLKCSGVSWTRSLLRKISPHKINKSSPSDSPFEESDISTASCLPEDITLDDCSSLSDDSDSDSESDEELERMIEIEILPCQPPRLKKYTCLPSPLHESLRPASFRILPRHAYQEHGHSRNSLQQLKWFWALREEMWQEDAAYGGVTSRSPTIPTTTVPTPAPLPPMSIHPRRGDLPSVRDPFCVHMDRYFVGMPMWTMGKALWMFDMHMASEGRKRTLDGACSTDAGSDSESDSEDDDLSRSCSSDDTLVESDGESETSPVKRLRKTLAEPAPDYVHRLPWETNWYKRTELLLQLTRQHS